MIAVRRTVIGGLFFVGVVFMAVLSACTWSYDAAVLNPCDRAHRVETYTSAPEEFDRFPPIRAVTIAADSEFVVENAYHSSGSETWSMRIVDYGVIPVDGGAGDVSVTIPVEACSR